MPAEDIKMLANISNIFIIRVSLARERNRYFIVDREGLV
jgi:hypothetical protein